MVALYSNARLKTDASRITNEMTITNATTTIDQLHQHFPRILLSVLFMRGLLRCGVVGECWIVGRLDPVRGASSA